MPYPVYYPICAEQIPDHIADNCPGAIEHARARSVGFVHTSYLDVLKLDPTDEATWVAGIDEKQIIIIPDTTGTYDGGTPVDGPGYGDLETSLAGYRHVVNYKDPNYRENVDFYNAIKYSRSWVPAIRLETQTILFDKPAVIIPKTPVTENLTDDVVVDVELRISQPDLPVPFDTPPGVFIPYAYV
jgi:hypothetical protein